MSSPATAMSLVGDRETVMTRVFDAPPEVVFRAYTDPEAVRQWWGLRANTTTVDTMDVRPGGKWRFEERDPEGTVHGFRGEYREVSPPNRLVYTFEYEGMPGHIVVDTVTFEDQDGKTLVTAHSRFETPEDRTGMVEAGMESGANESWDRLAEYLQTI